MEEGNLNINKMLGIGTGWGDAIVGQIRSLTTFPWSDNTEWTLKFLCHSLHLVASKACENLPRILTFVVKESSYEFRKKEKKIRDSAPCFNTEIREIRKRRHLAESKWRKRKRVESREYVIVRIEVIRLIRTDMEQYFKKSPWCAVAYPGISSGRDEGGGGGGGQGNFFAHTNLLNLEISALHKLIR